ncbi:MAG: hypothetical protein PVF79_21245 [Desulfobacterales bacterium]|jgi:hypothetical protein
MKTFLEKYSKRMKILSLLVIILTPFLLYFAANVDNQPFVVLLLGLMGGGMLLALWFG